MKKLQKDKKKLQNVYPVATFVQIFDFFENEEFVN